MYFRPSIVIVNYCPSYLLTCLPLPPPPPFPKPEYIIYRQCVWAGWEGVGGGALYLTRVRTYSIALPPKTKT
jgi:hypothetical protein